MFTLVISSDTESKTSAAAITSTPPFESVPSGQLNIPGSKVEGNTEASSFDDLWSELSLRQKRKEHSTTGRGRILAEGLAAEFSVSLSTLTS